MKGMEERKVPSVWSQPRRTWVSLSMPVSQMRETELTLAAGLGFLSGAQPGLWGLSQVCHLAPLRF